MDRAKNKLRFSIFNFLFLLAQMVWPVTTLEAKYSGGSGEPNNPYKIANAADLLILAADTNDYGKCFILTADINLGSSGIFTTAVIAPDINNENWEFDGVFFAGVFDGAGHKINNLTIIGVGNNYLGLFGYVSGKIENLGVENVSITGGWCGDCGCNSTEIGGLLGENHGTISNCNSTGDVNGGINAWDVGGLVGYNNEGSISNCHSTAAVTGGDTSYDLGGLVGYNYMGLISNCYSTGIVTSSYDSWDIGGLVGENDDGSISNCYSTGTVTSSADSEYVGGLVGENIYGSISNCYSTGNITGGNGAEELGGLVGDNWGIISNCYSTGAVTGGDGALNLGGLVGWIGWDDISDCYFLITSGPDNGAGTPLTDEQMKLQASFVGWDFNAPVWKIYEGRCYPYLAWEKYGGGSGTPANPYRIWTVAELLAMAADTGDYDKHFIVMNNLNLDPGLPGGEDFGTAVIGGTDFVGLFDGDGHKIINLTINTGGFGTDSLGLFGYVSSGGEIKNLGLENVSITGGFSSSGIGGLVGGNAGTIINCYSTGAVAGGRYASDFGGLVGGNAGTIINCYSTCAVTSGDGSYDFGGLIGQNSGTVSYCYASGDVTGGGGFGGLGGLVGYNNGAIDNSYSVGTVNGSNSWQIGGLVGLNDGSISECHSTGTVTGSSGSYCFGGLVGLNSGPISNCYATGNVNHSSDEHSQELGGLVGWNFGNISNCYAAGNIVGGNGSKSLGGFVGAMGWDAGSVSNSYSTGNVICGSGSYWIGGLVGNGGHNVSHSYFLITGGPANGYGEPLTDEQMRQQGSFVGWDFVGETANGYEDFWRLCNEGLEYPKLGWQYVVGDVACPDGVGTEDLEVLCEQWLLEEIPDDLAPPGGDGTVNFADFAVFGSQWGVSKDINDVMSFAQEWLKMGLRRCSADIWPQAEGDGLVNEPDFALLGQQWLTGI